MPKKGELSPPPTDLIGKKFGHLTILEFDHRDNHSRQYWKCHCDLCGNNKVMSRRYLLQNIKCVKACGCMQGKKNIANTYNFSNEQYVIGYTSKKEPFYLDYEDYDLVKQYNWYVNSNGYIQTTDYSLSKPKKIFMHRMIMHISDNNTLIDHINHNKTDNRKNNLRVVTNSQNQMNATPRLHSSPCTGVSWHKTHKKWIAQIQVNKKLKYLGIYDNLEDAIRARKYAEEKYFKEYAYRPI